MLQMHCRNIPEGDASLLRSKVANILENPGPIKSNITLEECKALTGLRQDDSIVCLPADKGKCVVVLDKSEYQEKCDALLSDTKTYTKLGKRNPTSGYKKNGLVPLLTKYYEVDKQINKDEHFFLYPTTETPPKFYGLPKIHKNGRPLRPIVSSIGSITYPSSKYLARILKPLVGQTEHHIKNSAEYVDKVKHERVEDDETIVSHDVVSLFTSVPVDKAVTVIHNRLLADDTLAERTCMSVANLVELLSFVLNTTYFIYNGVYYKQIHGAAMGSPVSPIVCNLYLEELEQLAISTALHPPAWWYRYVDDTNSKHKKARVQEFTDFLNSLDEDIQWTHELPARVDDEDQALAFLDSLSCVQIDGSLKVKVYRKATHTDWYLNWDSCHPVEHKLSVIRTLYHRATSVVTHPEDQEAEFNYIDTALTRCGYPQWSLEHIRTLHQAKLLLNSQTPPATAADSETTDKTKTPVVTLPHIPGLTEKLQRVFFNHGVKVCQKPTNKLRSILTLPKDKSEKGDITGPVYYIPCSGSDHPCSEFYIGETDRALWTRFLEHRRPCSVDKSEVAQHLHVESPGHQIDFTDAKVLDRDHRWFERGVREAIYIRAQEPTLNRNQGRYTLPAVWNRIIHSHIKQTM